MTRTIYKSFAQNAFHLSCCEWRFLNSFFHSHRSFVRLRIQRAISVLAQSSLQTRTRSQTQTCSQIGQRQRLPLNQPETAVSSIIPSYLSLTSGFKKFQTIFFSDINCIQYQPFSYTQKYDFNLLKHLSIRAPLHRRESSRRAQTPIRRRIRLCRRQRRKR